MMDDAGALTVSVLTWMKSGSGRMIFKILPGQKSFSRDRRHQRIHLYPQLFTAWAFTHFLTGCDPESSFRTATWLRENLGRRTLLKRIWEKQGNGLLAERYSNAFGIEAKAISHSMSRDEEMLEEELLEPQYPQNRYVTNQNGEAVRKVISEIVILIGAVDNNRSRQGLSQRFPTRKGTDSY